MQPALDSNILERLIALGREQGHLTNQDLEANLPIASMSAEDIALIVVHLEETGIPVELEDSLTSPSAGLGPAPLKSAEIIPFPDRAAAARIKQRKAPLQKAPASQTEPAKSVGSEKKRSAHWAVAVSGLLVLVLMAGLVMMLGV